MRTFDPGVRERMPELIEEVVRGVTSAHGAEYELDYTFGYQPVVNDERATALVRDGDRRRTQLTDLAPIMGGDDFSAYLAEAPAATRSSAPATRTPARRSPTTTRASASTSARSRPACGCTSTSRCGR